MQRTVDVHLGRSFIDRSDCPVPDLHEKGVYSTRVAPLARVF